MAVDLDTIQGQVEAIKHDQRHGVLLSAEHIAAWYLDDVPALVAELRAAREELAENGGDIQFLRLRLDRAQAELRAAREVVKAAEGLDAGIYLGARDRLTAALAAYDKVTGEVP